MPFVDRLTGLVSPAAGLRRALLLAESGRTAEAFPLIAAAARAGIVDAEYRVARCYLEGSGVPPSRVEGARWLLVAANHGNADAQALLAALYVAGLVPAEVDAGAASDRLFRRDTTSDPNFEAAFRFATKAAEAGSASGQAVLGYILTNGPVGLRDEAAAHRWYERSAAAGCAEGSLGLALSLAGRGLDADRPKIAQELRRAADGDLPTAIYLLAILTENGQGVARDPEAAAGLYETAAEKGITAAQLRLGQALLDGELGTHDPAVGEAWVRRAALAGNADAAFLLGDRIVRGGDPNFAEAAAWFRQAADGGQQAAARALASLYFTGNGVAKDAVLLERSRDKTPGDALGLTASNRLAFTHGPGGAEPALVGKTEIAPRSWHHAALVREGRRVVVYLDGKPEIQGEAGADASGLGSTFTLGDRLAPSAAFEGKLDEVAVYGRALRPDEVAEHVRAATDPSDHRE